MAKGKRVNKQAEKGAPVSEVEVQAVDRAYKDILSSSPLKYRVPLDLYGTPTEKQLKAMKERSKSREVHEVQSASRNKKTPLKNAKTLQNSDSVNKF